MPRNPVIRGTTATNQKFKILLSAVIPAKAGIQGVHDIPASAGIPQYADIFP